MPSFEVLGGGRLYEVFVDDDVHVWASRQPPRWYCRSASDSRRRFVFRPVTLRRARDGEQTSRFQYLPRVIMRVRTGLAVTYRDGNPLNLVRANLRVVELAELPKMAARSRRRRGGRRDSPYFGVYLQRRSGKWQTLVRISGHLHYFGSYETPEEAADVHDEAVRANDLDRRRLNFPEPQELEGCRVEMTQ